MIFLASTPPIQQEPIEEGEKNFSVFVCETCSLPYYTFEAAKSCRHGEENTLNHIKEEPDENEFIDQSILFQNQSLKSEEDTQFETGDPVQIETEPLFLPSYDENEETESFMCNVCWSVFKKKSYLMKHQYYHHSNREKFSCDLCGYVAKYKAHLLHHMHQKHMDKSFPCPQCSKIFKAKACLLRHLKVHEAYNEPANLLCPVCGKVFRSKNALNVHYRVVHFTLKEYNCDRCSYSSKFKPDLRKHFQVTHENLPKTLECPECKKAFRTKGDIYSHRRTVHSTKRFYCSMCVKSFKRNSCLNKHIRRAHTVAGTGKEEEIQEVDPPN